MQIEKDSNAKLSEFRSLIFLPTVTSSSMIYLVTQECRRSLKNFNRISFDGEKTNSETGAKRPNERLTIRRKH